MRRKVALGLAGTALAAAVTMVPAPAYACHNDIILSENPIHNWACMTVHETGLEERVAAYVQQVLCTLTGDCA